MSAPQSKKPLRVSYRYRWQDTQGSGYTGTAHVTLLYLISVPKLYLFCSPTLNLGMFITHNTQDNSAGLPHTTTSTAVWVLDSPNATIERYPHVIVQIKWHNGTKRSMNTNFNTWTCLSHCRGKTLLANEAEDYRYLERVGESLPWFFVTSRPHQITYFVIVLIVWPLAMLHLQVN